jgi:hypothetical protein
MELNTITRIEQFICDSLIASPLIPLNVNVLRLADAIENEGIVSQTNNVIVRYVGSNNIVKNRIPMIYEKEMRFELDFSCQNYLTSSGHDFATQLLTGCQITVTGSVPSGAYVQVIEPFSCLSENFTGLNEESQYTYVQTYSVVIEESLPFIALDPCVQRGDCRQLFPGNNVETRLPLGGVLDEASGNIYVPNYTGDDEEVDELGVKGVRWSNEITQSGNWVFVCDPDTVFIEDPLGEPIYLLSNNNYTEDGRLVVTIWDAETRTPIREVFYINTGKKLARYAVELWRNVTSSEGQVGSRARVDSSFFSGLNVGQFAIVKGAFAIFYTDPMNSDAKQLTLMGGTLIGVQTDVFVQTPRGRFYYVQQSPQGKGWLLEDSFELASINSLWKLGCLPCEGGQSPNILC